MALPILPLAAGAAALVFLLSKKSSAAAGPPSTTTGPYNQAPADGSKPATPEPKPPAKTWKEMPQALQEQVAAALGALGVSPATGELGTEPVGADAIKLATQTAALCESQGFYEVASELNRLAGLAAKKVPTPKEAEPIKAAAPPGLTPEQIEAIARTLTLDRDPKSIEALLKTLMLLPPSQQRDDFISMAQALLLQLAAAQSTTQTMQQIDQVIKSPGIAEVNQAVQPLPPAVIPVVNPTVTTSAPVLPAPSSPVATASLPTTHAGLAPLTGTRLLQQGSSGADVKAWQAVLRLDGFASTVNADGVYGSKTTAATKAWQKQRGLTADGKVGPATRAKIGTLPVQDKPVAVPAPVATASLPTTHAGLKPLTGSRLLQNGSTGADVKAWQAILRLDGFGSTVTADGVYGAKTVAATKAWQTQRGIGADGKVGPGTRAKIGSPAVKAATAAAPAAAVKAPAQTTPAPSALTLDKFPDPSPKARTLQKGSKGEDVKSWQRILIAMGYPMGTFGPNKDGVDGDFGATADKQTRAFQQWALNRYKDPRITVDGKVGPTTRRLVLMRTAEAKAAQVAGRYAA